ncbi:unnamed protein product [Calypogeia fissa]
MPSSPTIGRKLGLSRNGSLWRDRGGGHSRQARCSPQTWIQVLYGVIAILLFAVVLLWRSRLDTLRSAHSLPCGAVEDTLRSLVVVPGGKQVVQQGITEDTACSGNGNSRSELISRGVNQDSRDGDIQKAGESRPKVLGFVGIQTGFKSAERRRSIRKTWLPSTPEGIMRLEKETGLVIRFVIGTTSDTRAAAELQTEIDTYKDFLRIANEEEYSRLPFKTLEYFQAAYMLYDADFYVKIDDDIYLRPDRLALLLKQKRQTSRTYLGCMKRGGVITDPQYKWYEPLNWLLGNEYFMHAWGPIYALSRDIVADLSNFKNDSLRMFSNEDVTIGSWMLAFNVNHEDDRRLCEPECQVDSIAVWDIPTCSGLCSPEKKLLLLHQQDACSKGPAEYKG